MIRKTSTPTSTSTKPPCPPQATNPCGRSSKPAAVHRRLSSATTSSPEPSVNTNPQRHGPIRAITIWALALLFFAPLAHAQAAVANDVTPFHDTTGHQPLDLGVLVQGGTGLTENRDGFKFLMAGVHAGKGLTRPLGPG